MRDPLKSLEPHLDETAFYRELTSRNHHFISADTQAKLKNFKILIAGCGSTGGACIEALARVGVTQFVLTDNGTYDVSNLNRQHARLDAIGKNKASFHREEVLAIPLCKLPSRERGRASRQCKSALSGSRSCFRRSRRHDQQWYHGEDCLARRSKTTEASRFFSSRFRLQAVGEII